MWMIFINKIGTWSAVGGAMGSWGMVLQTFLGSDLWNNGENEKERNRYLYPCKEDGHTDKRTYIARTIASLS